MSLKTINGKHIVKWDGKQIAFDSLGSALKFLWGKRYES